MVEYYVAEIHVALQDLFSHQHSISLWGSSHSLIVRFELSALRSATNGAVSAVYPQVHRAELVIAETTTRPTFCHNIRAARW